MHVQLSSKFQRLRSLAAGNPAWAREVLQMSPAALGRCLAASHKVLDRLEFFQATGEVGGGDGEAGKGRKV